MNEPPHHPQQIQRLADICFAIFQGDVFTTCRERRFVDARITFSKLLHEQGYGCSQIGNILGRDHSTVIHYFKRGEELIEMNRPFRHRYVKAREEYIGHDPVFYYSAPELRAKFLEIRDAYATLDNKHQSLLLKIKSERRLEPLIDMIRIRTNRGSEDTVYEKLNRIYNGL